MVGEQDVALPVGSPPHCPEAGELGRVGSGAHEHTRRHLASGTRPRPTPVAASEATLRPCRARPALRHQAPANTTREGTQRRALWAGKGGESRAVLGCCCCSDLLLNNKAPNPVVQTMPASSSRRRGQRAPWSRLQLEGQLAGRSRRPVSSAGSWQCHPSAGPRGLRPPGDRAAGGPRAAPQGVGGRCGRPFRPTWPRILPASRDVLLQTVGASCLTR